LLIEGYLSKVSLRVSAMDVAVAAAAAALLLLLLLVQS